MRHIFTLALLSTSVALAQGLPPGFGGKKAEEGVNLGALGLLVDPAATSLRVRTVLEGSPAGAAGVRVGDEIVKAGGKALSAAPPGPALQLIAALEEAEAAKKKPAVTLTVKRDGSELEVEVPLQKLGAHAKSCPKGCKKCDAVIKAGLEWLARKQTGDGCFPTDLGGKTGKVVVTSLGGLAFMAAGASFQAGGPLDKAVSYVMNNVGAAEKSPFGRMGGGGGGNWNQENWELGYGLVFLAEVARKTRRADVKAKCQELVKRIEQNQEASGGWAHGPGGPNALGYLELEIVGNYLLLGLGAARKLGLEVDEEKLEKALTWIEGTSPGDGGVGYSQRDGQRFGDPGRTAGAILAFAALGQSKRPFFARMVGYFDQNRSKLREGHVSPAMHLLAGAMASRLLGAKAWEAYIDEYRPVVMQQRRPDGSFCSMPTAETQSLRNDTDQTVGGCWLTATYVLILALPEAELPFLLGGKDDAKGKSEPKPRVKTGAGA